MVGEIKEGKIMGINSKKNKREKLSSFLGELQAEVWALKDVRDKIKGVRVCLRTDSNYVFHRLVNTPERELTEDSKVMRLLRWLWHNFPMPARLRLEFIPKDLNVGEDLFSRWYGKKQKDLGRVNQT